MEEVASTLPSTGLSPLIGEGPTKDPGSRTLDVPAAQAHTPMTLKNSPGSTTFILNAPSVPAKSCLFHVATESHPAFAANSGPISSLGAPSNGRHEKIRCLFAAAQRKLIRSLAPGRAAVGASEGASQGASAVTLLRVQSAIDVAMPVSQTMPLRFGQRLGSIKSIIKFDVNMVRLKSERGAERRGIGREAAMTIVNVPVVSNCGPDGGLAKVGNGRGGARWLTPCTLGDSAAEDPLGAELLVDNLADRCRHRRIGRRAVGLEAWSTAVFNPEHTRDMDPPPMPRGG